MPDATATTPPPDAPSFPLDALRRVLSALKSGDYSDVRGLVAAACDLVKFAADRLGGPGDAGGADAPAAGARVAAPAPAPAPAPSASAAAGRAKAPRKMPRPEALAQLERFAKAQDAPEGAGAMPLPIPYGLLAEIAMDLIRDIIRRRAARG